MPGLLSQGASAMDLPGPNATQQPVPNGIPSKPRIEQNGRHVGGSPNDVTNDTTPAEHAQLENGHELVNGVGLAQVGKQNRNLPPLMNRLDGLPIEIRQLTEHFRPFHQLVHRSVQKTWNNFSDLIDQLSEITVASSTTAPSNAYSRPQVNGTGYGDQSDGNLDKKDRLLKFQQDERADYIKLLTLHDWFKKSRRIDWAIELSMWLHDQRGHFTQAADFIGNMKRELAVWQVPNPDLRTAVEILSKGKVSSLSDLGYRTLKPLSSKGILRTLQDINILLCARLSLHDQVPLPLSKYRIHDGRVTFIVPYEFQLDLSVADEDHSSQFYFIDFKYMFLQPSTSLTGRLYDEFAGKVNGILKADGLLGCYDFLHDLTLSYKLNMLRGQVLEMARKQWSENLRIDLINRTLVVQYWLNRPMPKSWIEIGAKSGRRKKRQDRFHYDESHLDLRWKPEKKEDLDIQVDFNVSPLSMEDLLHGIVSRHSSIILKGLYEQLLQCKLFSRGKLSLELSCSDTDPSDCSLRIQLTSSKHTTVAVEPISGSLILQPASSLSGRTEFELNRLENPVEDGLQRISMLRCQAAEQEMARQANLAGWEVLQTFRLSQSELKAVFPSEILRYVLLRLPSWQPSVMMAATFSMEGDKWWLLFPSQQSSSSRSTILVSQEIDCLSLQAEDEPDSLDLFSQLSCFASGAITWKIAEQDLRLKGLLCRLPALPPFQKDIQLPLFGVTYVLVDARGALRSSLPTIQSNGAETGSLPSLQHDQNDEDASWIEPSICLKFMGLNDLTQSARLVAKGRTTASARVLQSLAALTGPRFKLKENAREFLLSFQVPIGQSFVAELFTTLRNFDRLLSCLTIIKSFESIRIQSLSLSQIAIEYNAESALNATIDFPSPSSTVAIRLFPESSNPHGRIRHFLEKLLPDLRRPFTANLGGVLTMLKTTHPLLQLFDELERLQTPIDPAAEDGMTPASSNISLHLIARTPTHYALQYFASSTSSDAMVARFEIFHHLRRDAPVWILRPALEETVSYSRSSFMHDSLKQKLIDDVFTVRGVQAWLGLDTGASCPIDSPSALMRKVDEVVRVWAKESMKDVAPGGQKQAHASNKESGENGSEPKMDASFPSELTQHLPHQQLPGRGPMPKPAANGTSQSKPSTTASRSLPQSSQQRPKDIITLD